jgi:hypothetical protein
MNSDGGFIKLWRKMLRSPIMQHDGLLRLWTFCLLRAEWKDSNVLIPKSTDQVAVRRGSFVTTRSRLHAELYRPEDADKREMPSPSQITLWRWLQSLERAECLKLENVNNRYTIVTICKYETYQQRKDDCEQPVNNWRSTDDQLMNNVPLEEEEKNERREEQNGQIDPATDLAQRFSFDGGSGTSAPAIARWRAAIMDLLDGGIPAAAIEAERTRKGRQKSEAPWNMRKRMLPSESGKPGMFDSLKRFVENGGPEK